MREVALMKNLYLFGFIVFFFFLDTHAADEDLFFPQKTIAAQYIDFLNSVGDQDPDMSLFTEGVKKNVNGKTVAEGRDKLKLQVANNYYAIGSWKVVLQEVHTTLEGPLRVIYTVQSTVKIKLPILRVTALLGIKGNEIRSIDLTYDVLSKAEMQYDPTTFCSQFSGVD